MAYTRNIGKDIDDSHQTSPGYVLCFTRLSYRDVYNYTDRTSTSQALETRKPLIVINDAISINIQYSKSNPVPTFSCVLMQGDINYMTAVHPGDYLTVNLVNWGDKVKELRDRIENGDRINRKQDGFKGLFKILDVNMTLQTLSSGEKRYYVQITARGFDEFNTILYFNPALASDPSLKDGSILFSNSFANFKDNVFTNTENIQDILKIIIVRTIGKGYVVPSLVSTLNQIDSYQIPNDLGKLLGIPNAKLVSDINKYYLGIWSFTNKNGFSSFFQKKDIFFETTKKLQGTRILNFQDLQSVSVWSLLEDFCNKYINEMYTCYREDEEGNVFPSLIIRQKPFNTKKYKNIEKEAPVSPHTVFFDVPRWKINPSLIIGLNIGRSDKGRINFVQVNTRGLTANAAFDATSQIVSGNFVEDKQDVIRNGRKPYTVSCFFDPPTSIERPGIKAREWAYLLSDWLFNGHLKLNGTMETVGIEEAICVGDNLEFDDIIYHIETVTHSMNVTSDGLKSFRTSLSLSMGVDLKSTEENPVYGEMDHTDSYTRRVADFNKERVLPGFSDTQDIPGRQDGEEITETEQKSFTIKK